MTAWLPRPTTLCLLLASVGIEACTAPNVDAEASAAALFDMNALVRDGLMLTEQNAGPTPATPDITMPAAGAAPVALAMRVPSEGDTFPNDEGGVTRVTAVEEIETNIYRITLFTQYGDEDERSVATTILEVHVGSLPDSAVDDRLLRFDIAELTYRDGSTATLTLVDGEAGTCDRQTDCELVEGEVTWIASREFPAHPELKRFASEVATDLGVKGVDTDNYILSVGLTAVTVDDATYAYSLIPATPTAPGEAPVSGTLTEAVFFPATSDSDNERTGTVIDAGHPLSIENTRTWTTRRAGSVASFVTYRDGTSDSYTITFLQNGTGTLEGTFRNGVTVSGTMDRVNGQYALDVHLSAEVTVSTSASVGDSSVTLTRSITVEAKERKSMTATITHYASDATSPDARRGEIGTLTYDGSDGISGRVSLRRAPTGIALTGGTLDLPSGTTLEFSGVMSATQDGHIAFQGDTFGGALGLSPLSGGVAVIVDRSGTETSRFRLSAAGEREAD